MPTTTDPAAMLAAYLAAEAAVLQGKTVSFEGRSVSRENLQEIRAGRKEWERRLAAKEAAKNPHTFGGLSVAHARLDR